MCSSGTEMKINVSISCEYPLSCAGNKRLELRFVVVYKTYLDTTPEKSVEMLIDTVRNKETT